MSADKTITFGHHQSVLTLPEGTYRGFPEEAEHSLGANGMGRKWQFVRITSTPKGAEHLIGTCGYIWLTQSTRQNR